MQTINKDILTVETGIIAHFCNCLGAFGGLAGAIGKKYPVAYEQYIYIVNKKPADLRYELLGEIQLVEDVTEVGEVDGDILSVANMFTQYDVGTDGRKTEYCAVKNAMESLARKAYFDGSPDIYFPFGVGAGLGGGNRQIIEKIIEESFADYTGKVYSCKL